MYILIYSLFDMCALCRQHLNEPERCKSQQRHANFQPRRRIHNNENERAGVIGAPAHLARIEPGCE